MKIVIITVAGVSSRFNEGIPEEEKILKCLYYEENPEDTLIYKMVKKSDFADRIVIVGGYKYQDLISYIDEHIPQNLQEKILLIENDHFSDLSSGYSLYLGINESFNSFGDIDEILLTYNFNPIYSNKAVVLYQNENDEYHYLFSTSHGMLSIGEPFKAIFNSGQVWKFKDMNLLKIANDNFKENLIEDTNLGIIQKYFDLLEDGSDVDIIGLKHWVNCNTREDYKLIKNYWSGE